jgi:hypothetical protein
MRAPKPEPSPPGVADALACAAAAVAFGWSKFANVLPAALMALVFGAIIVFAQAGGPAGRAASRRRKAVAAAAVCATAAALAALFAIYAAVPRWMESQTTYNAIYFGILRDAGEGEAEGYLRDMGVNPAYARLRDTNYYVEDIGERIKAASAAAGRAGAPAAEVALSETWDATSASAGIADAEIGRAGVADAESAVAANARREAASVTADATPDAPAAEAPASQAAALGLEPAESALAAAAPANSAAGRAEYLVSKPELLLFYLGHPSRLLRALDISLKNAGFIRPYYLSNFGAQRPRLSFAGRFSLWGRFRAQAGFDTAYGALALMLASALALWRAVARRTARRAPGNLRGGRRGGAGRRFGMAARDALVFAGALCACAAIVFYAFAIPIVSNGEADLAKHMFLYAHLSDMMFLFALASAMNSPAQAAPGAAPAQGSASAPRRPLLAQDLAICACLAVLLALPPASRQLGSFVMARASHAAPEAGAYVSFGRMAGGAVGDAVTAGAAGVAVGEPIVWRIAAVNGGDGNHANDDGSDDSNSGNNGSNGDSGDSGSGNGNAGNANSSNDDNAGNSDARGDNSVDGAGSADSGNRGNSDNGDNGGAGGNGSGNSGNDSNHNGGASGAGDSSRSRASGDGGATALLVSEGAVASMPFSADNSGDWEGSGLREWLNGAFLECFSDDELGLILPYERDVLLSVETKGRAERGDRDFYATHVPSLSARGFDTAYRRRVTDMVALPDIQAVAAASDGGAATALGGGPAYWLCSPYYNNGQMARCVFPDGFVYFQDAKETLAVRPAIMIDMAGPRAGSGSRDDPYVLGQPISRSGA